MFLDALFVNCFDVNYAKDLLFLADQLIVRYVNGLNLDDELKVELLFEKNEQ